MRYRVESVRTIQDDDAGNPATLEQDIAHAAADGAAAFALSRTAKSLDWRSVDSR
jgi:hypothetical protein